VGLFSFMGSTFEDKLQGQAKPFFGWAGLNSKTAHAELYYST
jgi:hypothetical protein